MLRPLCMFVILSQLLNIATSDYWKEREEFINNEDSLAIGSQIRLSSKEQVVNKLLIAAKQSEMNYGFVHPETFPPARHFFEAKSDILKSEVFKIISKMPKGGALHIHDIALSSSDYVLNNITYRDNLFASVNGDDIYFVFAEKQPNKKWALVKDLRRNNPNFDEVLKTKISLVTKNPMEKYPDINTVWKAFSNIFITTEPLLTYRPVFEDYFYNAMEEFYQDNVNYMEVRGTLPTLYDLNGTTYESEQVLGILKNVATKFTSSHPDFIGIKYIYAPIRRVNNETMNEFISIYKSMKATYPSFLVGFDLVGQEDLGQPLTSFINQLTNISHTTKFYFHAGETNWNGMSTDLNLIDAILLNATRIGHGYALVKHPAVLKQIKQRQIGIEICPISNQVLNLVKDLRNHPGNILIANNYPVVISSDDPGLWGAHGLSFDFYQAFMGMASYQADLRLLKQLALNSIFYSSMNKNEKIVAVRKFYTKWNLFINEFSQNNTSHVTVTKV